MTAISRRSPPTAVAPSQDVYKRQALERAREAAGQPPPVALLLPEHVARRDAPVRAHKLSSYDRKPKPNPKENSDE